MSSIRLSDIQAPINEEIAQFEVKFKEAIKSRVMLLEKITGYVVKRKGKQLRPMLVFLSAHIAGGVTEASYTGASLIELLHTATLIHDDVVDDANYRRGFFSVNALWKNKVAVLMGDYLLSRGLLLSIQEKQFALLEIVSEAVRAMSEGELLQIEKARRLDITEKVYFEVIKQKTASLIASCCAAGAHSAGADADKVQLAYQFGEKVGIAFQIKDDLFDYGDDAIGKPLGIDIKEKKMTLPLIYALQQASSSEKRHIINSIRNKSEKPEVVQEVINFVKDKQGLKYATSVMEDYYTQAMKLLYMFPESKYRTAMEQLVRFTIDRTK